MATSTPLTVERIWDWLEGRLSAQEAATVAAQVAGADVATQAEVAWARAFLKVSETVVVEAPPPQVHQKLQQLFTAHWQQRPTTLARTTTATGESQPGFFQRLVAALTFDTYLQPGLAGVRSAESMTTRQLVYSAGVADVALNLRRDQTAGRHTLLGQLLPTGDLQPATVSVQLLHNQREAGITLADDLGEFAFADLADGEYQLILSADQLDLLLPPFALGQQE